MTRFNTWIVGLLVSSIISTASARSPNVVLILSDDQTWNDYSFMGHPHIETPHIDKLAAQSATFTRGYVPISLCCPSLASIITGLYPHQHKITGNEPPRPEGVKGNPYATSESFRADVESMISLIDDVPTLPRILGKEKNYSSFQSGKWWQGNYRRGGFTEGMTRGFPEPGGRHGDDGLKIGREGMQPVFDFIDKAGDDPFLLWYAPFLPHTPHNPPKRLLEKYQSKTDSESIARYWAMCEWFDETCGALLGHLDDRNLAEDTIVVYVTDNGWIQDPKAGHYDLKSKRSQYDGGIRTPIMVRWTGKVQPETITTPVSSIDIAPTVLKACGLAVPQEMSGIDLLDRSAVEGRKAIFGDCHLHNAVDVQTPAKNLTYRWCIYEGWKLILPNKKNVTTLAARGASGLGQVELFRIEEDPWEENNLAQENPEIVQQLQGYINAWWTGL
ncbi:MAG: arylsulfatase A-like enzyme [Verrucomicrobiales bacterium]|jgi:arylsulfatase A-like enzyme